MQLDVLEITINFILGIIASSIYPLYFFVRGFLKQRHLMQILNFSKKKRLYFIYPPRASDYDVLLPRTATEDFMAINNLISALLSIGWDSDQFIIRDTNRFVWDEVEKNNVLIICSPKSNDFARKIQKELRDNGVNFYYFDEVVFEEQKQWAITDGNGIFPSPSSRTILKREKRTTVEEVKKNSIDNQFPNDADKPLYERSLQDFAAITKVRNPWSPEHQIILVAGIRGIGTWGAAETLKKWYSIIHKAKQGGLGKFRKDSSFSALLKIYYRNSDIVDVELMGLIDIDDTRI